MAMNALGSLAFEPLPEGMFWSLYWSLLHVGPVTQAIDESADDSGGFGMYDPSHSNYGPSDDYGASRSDGAVMRGIMLAAPFAAQNDAEDTLEDAAEYRATGGDAFPR
jgi:hypothetical protein